MAQPGTDIINPAIRALTGSSSADSIDTSMSADAFSMLNDILDDWSNEKMMMYYVTEITFTLTSAKYTYTMGTSGTPDVNTTRPMRINSGFVRVSTLDYPLEPLNVEQYELIGLKSLSGSWPRAFYYQPVFPNGVLNVWPSPSQGEVHLFVDLELTRFTTINDTISLPQGYIQAMKWNLAEYLIPDMNVNDPVKIGKIEQFARQSKARIKRMNMQPPPAVQFPAVLLIGQQKDASFIQHGGFNR